MTPNYDELERLLAEIERQLRLKSEVTSIGPPHVVLNGETLRAELTALRSENRRMREFATNVIDYCTNCREFEMADAIGEMLNNALSPEPEATGGRRG